MVLLKSKSGKHVEFAPAQVEFMKAHGWAEVQAATVTKVAESKPKSKSKRAEIK